MVGGRGTGAAANALATRSGPIKLMAMADVFAERLSNSHEALKNAATRTRFIFFEGRPAAEEKERAPVSSQASSREARFTPLFFLIFFAFGAVFPDGEPYDHPFHVLLAHQGQELLQQPRLAPEGQEGERRGDQPKRIGEGQAYPASAQVHGHDPPHPQPPEAFCPARLTSSWITLSVMSTSLV
jgi:hypothetical protein